MLICFNAEHLFISSFVSFENTGELFLSVLKWCLAVSVLLTIYLSLYFVPVSWFFFSVSPCNMLFFTAIVYLETITYITSTACHHQAPE